MVLGAVPLLLPTGAKPLARWEVIGTTRRVPTPAHGFVVQMVEGSPPTRITIGGKRPTQFLGLRHRWVVLEVRPWLQSVLCLCGLALAWLLPLSTRLTSVSIEI